MGISITGGVKVPQGKFSVKLVSGGGGFSVNAVNFDGSNDYLTHLLGLTEAGDNKVASFSFWYQPATDLATHRILQTENVNPGIIVLSRLADGTFNVQFTDLSSDHIWIGRTTLGPMVTDSWAHALCSVDSATGDRTIYINDTAMALQTDIFNADGVIHWEGIEWTIGAVPDGDKKADGDMAELWFTNEFIDFTVEANRRKFIDAGGKPVDLGEDGSTPTGTAPLIFLSGDTDAWHENKGSGGDFIENGALTDADTSPSD